MEGLSDDAALVVWTLRELSRGDSSSYAPLLQSLPQGRLHTGLTLSEHALERLGDTLCGQQAQRLRDAARAQYDELLPVLQSYGVVPDFALYCWTVEIWQSYAVAVVRDGVAETALLPLLFLLNHRAGGAHALRFSVPDADGVLRVRAERDCAQGEQLFLSYGSLANAQLLAFYGFAVADNPHEEVPLGFGPDEDEDIAAVQTELMDRWGLEWEQSLRAKTPLPEALLSLMRVLTADAEELHEMQRAESGGPPPPSPAGLQVLGDALEALIAQLPPAEEEQADADADEREMRHVAVYLAGQRRILEQAAAQVTALLAGV